MNQSVSPTSKLRQPWIQLIHHSQYVAAILLLSPKLRNAQLMNQIPFATSVQLEQRMLGADAQIVILVEYVAVFREKLLETHN